MGLLLLFLVPWIVIGILEWVADQFDAGLYALAKRRQRRLKHQAQLRELEVEAKRRALAVAYPEPSEPTKPICGCTHDAAFHNKDTKLCHEEVGSGKKRRQCPCQGYNGPIPLSQIYADPLTELDGGFA